MQHLIEQVGRTTWNWVLIIRLTMCPSDPVGDLDVMPSVTVNQRERICSKTALKLHGQWK